jgi:P27 family predicted phage terminase small subunit
LDVVKEVDGSALAAYCEAWATLVDATGRLRREGLTYEGRNGMIRANPAATLARGASAEFRAWAAHFGLTPAAEQRITAAQIDDGDDNPFA